MLQMVPHEAVEPQKVHPERIRMEDWEYLNRLDYSGVEFSVRLNQVQRIENQNRIGINVFGYSDKQGFPLYISKERYDNQLNLLLLSQGEKQQ